MTDSPVVSAYSTKAEPYIEALGSVNQLHPADRDLIVSWARGIDGSVIDVGCGPGQWTNELASEGIDVIGIDPVEAFIDSARTRFPGVAFECTTLEKFFPTEPFSGVLAWYSLIHHAPEELFAALGHCRSILRPCGSLLLGFFEGQPHATFDHKVAPAWRWPMTTMDAALESAGFVVEKRITRQDPGVRAHGAIVARAIN